MVANAQGACVNSACTVACNATFTACMGGCILAQPDAVAGVFVAPGGGTGACGSESQPCATIAGGLAAIASSQGTKSVVYLANGTYTETVTLPAGIIIQGGWLDTGGTWTHQCVANPQSGAVIQAPANADRTIVASYNGSATLDTLTIQNIATAAAGQSLYGVFATGTTTQLLLKNVDIQVAGGGSGNNGVQGTSGAGGAASCAPTSDGAKGAPGTAGSGAAAGTYSASGYSPNTGGTGTAGASGDNGTAGSPGSCESVMSCGDDGLGNCVTSSTMNCGIIGGTGCPGGGSGPGTPGSGGGSSIGVFDWGAVVTIAGSTIAPGSGGNGGQGGAGGTPGSGSQGPTGTAGKYATSCHVGPTNCALTCTCHCIGPALTTGGAGGAGSFGGNGGTGGTGGGGSAGDSYCWYQGGGGTVNAANPMCTPGQAGQGGNAGQSSAGANGSAGSHN
jgi:hypothetical protein